MTTKKTILWWAYVLIGIVVLLFFAPFLISYPDTLLTLTGVALIVGYAVWSWHMWIRSLITLIKGSLS